MSRGPRAPPTAEPALGLNPRVLNNPLSFTDPSGFFFKSLFRAIGSVLKAVLKSSIVRAAIQIVACGVGGPPGCVAAAFDPGYVWQSPPSRAFARMHDAEARGVDGWIGGVVAASAPRA